MVFDIFNNFIAVENKMIAALQLKTHNLYDHNKYDMILMRKMMMTYIRVKR